MDFLFGIWCAVIAMYLYLYYIDDSGFLAAKHIKWRNKLGW